jgi:predicted anti-sigma-YlaC factor YlaD
MKCTQCEEVLSDYLEHTVEPSLSVAVEAHLSECSPCNQLLSGMREVIGWASSLPDRAPSPWLATRIVAATPRVIHETWLDTLVGVGKWFLEPRTAMAIFTATIVLSWLGSLAGVNVRMTDIVQDPRAIYDRAESFLNRSYGEAVQRYYKTPLVTQIQFQLERLREIS